MSISIEYLNNLSYKNNNIVIFVSKLSQLKSLNLPFDLQKHLNNKDEYVEELFENYNGTIEDILRNLFITQ